MKNISNMAAAESALRHMTELLFKPFNILNWLLLGLCAWLSQFGSELGAYINEIVKAVLKEYINDDKETIAAVAQDISQGDYSSIRDIVDIDGLLAINPIWIVLGVTVATLLGLLLLWVRSQSQLIFIDNLLHKSQRFFASFRENFLLGNSIFLWKIVYFCISPLIVLVGCALPLLLSAGWIKGCFANGKISTPDATAITGFVLSLVVLLVLSLLMNLLVFYFDEFIVPIVFIRKQNAFRATWTAARLFKHFTWTFIKYAILYLLLYMAAGTLVMVIVLCTCCTALILLFIPYIWAVFMLPILVFFRLFGLELLNQMYKHKIF